MYSLKRFLCALLAIVVLLFQLTSVGKILSLYCGMCISLIYYRSICSLEESAPYNDILQPVPTNAPASRQFVKNLLQVNVSGGKDWNCSP